MPSIIKDYWYVDAWKEVIPLISVLLERDTKTLIEFLISREDVRNSLTEEGVEVLNSPPLLLGACLVNEIHVGPDLLLRAIDIFVKTSESQYKYLLVGQMLKSKFREAFCERVLSLFLGEYEDACTVNIGGVLAEIGAIGSAERFSERNVLAEVAPILKSGDRRRTCEAILLLMNHYFLEKRESGALRLSRQKTLSLMVFESLEELFDPRDLQLSLSISWCLSWALESKLVPPSLVDQLAIKVVEGWVMHCDYQELRRIHSWVLLESLYPAFPGMRLLEIPRLEEIVRSALRGGAHAGEYNQKNMIVSVMLAWILGIDTQLSKEELKVVFEPFLTRTRPNIILFAKEFGLEIKRV